MFSLKDDQRLLTKDGTKAFFEALVVRSQVTRSKIEDQNCSIVDSVVDECSLVESRVLDSSLHKVDSWSSTFYKAYALRSNFENSFVSGIVKGSDGVFVTIEGGVVENVHLADGTHIKDGLWIRAPYRVTNTSFPYDVTESVDDQILVGCYSRSAAKWLQTTEAAVARIGLTKQQWIDYIKAIEDVALFKALNRSPRSLKGK